MRATGFAAEPPRQGFVRAQLAPSAGFLDTRVKEAGGGTQLVWDEAVAVPCHQGLAHEGALSAPPQHAEAEAEAMKSAGEPWADCPRVAPQAAGDAGDGTSAAECTPRTGAVPSELRLSLMARRGGLLQRDAELGSARVALADIPAVEPGQPPLDLWLTLHGKEGVREVGASRHPIVPAAPWPCSHTDAVYCTAQPTSMSASYSCRLARAGPWRLWWRGPSPPSHGAELARGPTRRPPTPTPTPRHGGRACRTR